MVDAIACSISLLVAFSSLMGRIGFSEVFILSLIGGFLYEVNSQLLWRLSITDTGYGMRIFAFGSTMSLMIGCLLGEK